MKETVARITADQVRSPRIRRLYEYWDIQRGRRGGVAPRRADIAPDDIRDLLGNIMIVDVERPAGGQPEPLRFRYRLVGTRVVEYNGGEFTGKYLGEIGWPEEADLLRSYIDMVESRRPCFGVIYWALVEGDTGHCEFARMPLSEDGVTVTQVLAIEDYDFETFVAKPARPD